MEKNVLLFSVSENKKGKKKIIMEKTAGNGGGKLVQNRLLQRMTCFITAVLCAVYLCPAFTVRYCKVAEFASMSRDNVAEVL